MARKTKRPKSGYCSIGHCEGTQPVGRNGNGMKTCEMWDRCGCTCHDAITEMFETAGQPRIPMTNPSRRKPVNNFIMPDPAEVERMKAESRGSSHRGPVFNPEAPLDINPIHFDETATGRRAKGQLEYEVLAICSSYLKNEYEDIEELTPAIIARLIDDREPPSVGAIGAIFKRWEEIDFAVIGSKPVRFVSYTVQGIQVGLDGLKFKAKQARKLQINEASRHVRPRSK